MMQPTIYLMCLLFAVSCAQQRPVAYAKPPMLEDADAIHCLKVTQLFPISTMETKKRAVFLGHDTMVFYIYSYKDMVLSNRKYKNYIQDVEGNLLDSIWTESFFVYKRGNTMGNNYDSVRFTINKRARVDSVMQFVWPHGQQNPAVLSVVLQESHFDEASQTLTEVYKYYSRGDSSNIGTLTACYSKKAYPANLYSLYPEMDSLKKMRLYKWVDSSHQRYFKEQNVLADAYTAVQMGEMVPVKDTAVIMPFFRREEAWLKQHGGK